MRVAIDSCVWIAYKSKRDANHEKAVQLINEFLNDKSLTACVTDYVIVEITNFLLKKTSEKTANETLELFLQHDRIKICIVDKYFFDKSCEIAKKFSVSLTDASIVSMMKEFGIKKLYSFDSEFDKIPNVERKEMP